MSFLGTDNPWQSEVSAMKSFSHISDLREREKVGYEVDNKVDLVEFDRVVDIFYQSVPRPSGHNQCQLCGSHEKRTSSPSIRLGNKSRVSIRSHQTPPR